MRSVNKRLAVVLAAVVVAGAACTASEPLEPLPPAAAAADEFLAAWSAGEVRAMAALLQSGDGRLSPARLRRTMERVLGGGAITSVAVERTEAIEQPPPEEAESSGGQVTLTVPYELTYASEAASRPVHLNGVFDLTYERSGERWLVAWDKALLLPGLNRAVRLDAVYRWGKRAAIFDRNGKVLARGRGASRTYPFGDVAGVTLGHLEPMSRKEVVAGAAGEIGDLAGGSGLEGAFDRRLAGVPSSRLVARSAGGRADVVLGRTRGKPGRPLQTTLDVAVQRAAQAGYGATLGGAVVMDPATGDLLAVLEGASFDPNNYVGAVDVEPFNRALAGLYPPGSAMKVVTASAALDAGVVKPDTKVTGPADYKGVSNFESGVYGTIAFASAVQFSVNTAFAQVAEDLGPKRITSYAKSFGFNQQPATIATAAESSFPFPQDLYELMWGSIGQAQVLATPLEMASVAGTVANDGVRMEPRIALHEHKQQERVLAPGTARTMTTLMESVVQGGTGTAAQISGVRVAGKTGTAEVNVGGGIQNHAWFVCFAPADNPAVAVGVVAELGGVGGQVAAPLARGILQRVLPLVA